MNAIEMLKSQHREAEALFAEIEKANIDDKTDLFRTLAQKLTGHMHIEEQIFYPAVYDVDSEEVTHGYEEHNEAKVVMDQLLAMEGGHVHFDKFLQELKDKIEHHVKEEETELFPRCEKQMPTVELDTLAEEMGDLLEMIEAQDLPGTSSLEITEEIQPNKALTSLHKKSLKKPETRTQL